METSVILTSPLRRGAILRVVFAKYSHQRLANEVVLLVTIYDSINQHQFG